MKDEIKEILDKLRSDDYYEKEYQKSVYYERDLKKLEDYITNLQEELKSANESISWWSNRFKAVEKENKRLKEDYGRLMQDNAYTLELEQRNEKAIDKLYCYGEVFDREILKQFQKEMLNILQGGDE